MLVILFLFFFFEFLALPCVPFPHISSPGCLGLAHFIGTLKKNAVSVDIYIILRFMAGYLGVVGCLFVSFSLIIIFFFGEVAVTGSRFFIQHAGCYT